MKASAPCFSRLCLADRHRVQDITRRFPPYSDFEFASLWAWNVREEVEWATWRDSIVFRFNDYTTGTPFYTFLGSDGNDALATHLVQLSRDEGLGSVLRLVPRSAASLLDGDVFCVQPAREHFDYIYEIDRYLTYAGGRLKTRRNFLNGFKRHYPNYQAVALDLRDGCCREQLSQLWRKWEENRGHGIPNEAAAFNRFLSSWEHFDTVATGIVVSGTLIAANVTVVMPGGYANGLFEKADATYHGVYAALMHEVSKALRARDCVYLNYEQDLGIESLRQSKMSFDPCSYLEKYTVAQIGEVGLYTTQTSP